MGAFLAILQMIPSIIGIVKHIETVIPGKGQGSAKLSLVLNTVNAAAQASPDVAKALAGHDLNATVSAIVSTTVATMNAAGLFQK